ncbi:hypothetical protein FJY94_02400 [Candidatus Kaiserbacteria bacterium]|nr:hypothetical protein [Candidatus Kaiserbacteria bacterium]
MLDCAKVVRAPLAARLTALGIMPCNKGLVAHHMAAEVRAVRMSWRERLFGDAQFRTFGAIVLVMGLAPIVSSGPTHETLTWLAALLTFCGGVGAWTVHHMLSWQSHEIERRADGVFVYVQSGIETPLPAFAQPMLTLIARTYGDITFELQTLGEDLVIYARDEHEREAIGIYDVLPNGCTRVLWPPHI